MLRFALLMFAYALCHCGVDEQTGAVTTVLFALSTWCIILTACCICMIAWLTRGFARNTSTTVDVALPGCDGSQHVPTKVYVSLTGASTTQAVIVVDELSIESIRRIIILMLGGHFSRSLHVRRTRGMFLATKNARNCTTKPPSHHRSGNCFP